MKSSTKFTTKKSTRKKETNKTKKCKEDKKKTFNQCLLNVIVVGIVRSLFAYLYGLLQHHSRIHIRHIHKLTEVYSSFLLCVVLSFTIFVYPCEYACVSFCFSSLHFFPFLLKLFFFAHKHLFFAFLYSRRQSLSIINFV